MGWSIITYVGIGIMIDPKEYWEDDHWLPYREEKIDGELVMLYGEGNKQYFFGQELIKQRNDNLESNSQEIEIPDKKVIADKIRSTGYDI